MILSDQQTCTLAMEDILETDNHKIDHINTGLEAKREKRKRKGVLLLLQEKDIVYSDIENQS